MPGRFSVTDELYFKAAGAHWAATGRFAAPELTGFTSTVPPLSEVFFPYPPLYPFLFGVYTKVVGFGPRSCILYDLAIHLLLVWFGVLAARLVHRVPWSASVLCGALLVPLGTVGRPDELGIVFALGAALALRKEVPHKFAIPIGGALLGFCCATSLGACLFLGSLVGWEATLREQSHLRKLRNLVNTALVAVVVALACVAPILVTHPLAYRQLVTVGTSVTVFANAGSGHHIPHIGFLRTWIYSLWYGYDKGVLIAGGLIFCLLCWRFDNNREGTVYSRFVLVVFSLLLLLVLMPGEYTYLWFSGTWLLIACVALGWRISRSLPPFRWRSLVAVAVLVWLIASMPYFRWKAILWTLPADQSLTVNIKRVQDEVPVGAGVLTADYWWALASRNPVYDPRCSHPGPDAFEYVVLTGNGSGQPGEPRLPEVGIEESQWQISDDHLRSEPPSIFGLRLSRSAYGFGPYILKKRSGPTTFQR
jgi:hypothetical protein